MLAPMQRWTTAYNTVQARMNKLEGVRLEVDSRRRTVAELGQKIDKQRARLPQTKSKGEFDIEQTIKKVQHKENKLAGLFTLTPMEFTLHELGLCMADVDSEQQMHVQPDLRD